jgi:hypothetical protein
VNPSPERVEELLAAFSRVLDENAAMPAVTRDDAASIAETLHADMDRGTAARDAEVEALGRTIACAKGCATCCNTIIITAEAESLSVARWLARPEQKKKRERFQAKYRRWRAANRDILDRATDACARGDRAALGDAIMEAGKRRAMCPFNHQGACEVYPVRPNVCRVGHALDTADGCGPGGGADVLDFVPITEFLARIRPLQELIQAALPDAPLYRGPLADRVDALLR